MKAITVHQPWAELIASGAKKYETRDWIARLPRPFTLAIHAGKSRVVDTADRAFMSRLAQVGIRDLNRLHYGAVLCICECIAIYDTEPLCPHLTEQELAFGNFAPGRYAWRMKVIERFEQPIATRGDKSLWEWARP